MPIQRAEFVCSSAEWGQCPADRRPEVAFIGRSNVGKSSLINMLTAQSDLAKVSGAPGKTRLINHFLINDAWYLVDLPGYGYAKLSKRERAKFDAIIQGYVLQRPNLYCMFLLLDARHAPLANDLEFMQWMGEHEVPQALVFTKCDKLSKLQLARNMEVYRARLLEMWEELPPLFLTSSLQAAGRDELVEYIESIVTQ